MNSLVRHDATQLKAKNLLIQFLTDWSKKSTIRIRLRQTYDKSKKYKIVKSIVVYIQSKFKRSINMNKARLILLTKLWVEVQQKMVSTLIKQKKDPKRLSKLQSITPDMREAVLKRYFAKCLRKHAASFFEWRRKRLRVRVRRSVELLCNLRRKGDHFIDEGMR